MKKIIIGIVTGAAMIVANMIVGMIFQYFVPSIKTEYENQQLFRPWSDPRMSLMFLQPFMVGIILAWIWSWVKNIVPGDTPVKKGLYFGFIYWIIAIPGMVISYGTFPVTCMLICSWSLGILVQSLCAGLMYSKLLK